MDTDLPFYYFTLTERFKTVQDDFDTMPKRRSLADPEPEESDNEDPVDQHEAGMAINASQSDGDDHTDVSGETNMDDDVDDVDAAMEYVNRLRNHPLRLQRLRLNRREDAAIFAANREYLPARHHRSIRAQFHTVASLPPAPR